MDCDIYLDANATVYNNNAKRVAFVLSLLSEGNAITWKMQYYRHNLAQNNGTFTAPTIADFVQDLREAFREVDEQESALVRLERLKQGG